MSFTQQLKQHLTNAGWNSNRKTTAFDSFMEEHNYPDFIRNFVRNYGDLQFRKLGAKEDDQRNWIDLNPKEADGYDGVLTGYVQDMGRSLYPVGYYKPEGMDIAVDDNGYVYLIGEYILCAGDDIYKGIEQIIRVDQRHMLSLDESNDTEIVWREFKNGKHQIVDLETYEFNYDFLAD